MTRYPTRDPVANGVATDRMGDPSTVWGRANDHGIIDSNYEWERVRNTE